MLSQSTFNAYVAKMRQLNTTAAEQMQKYIDRFGFDNMTAIVNYAHEVATQYGEASGELASLMYDMLAEDQGANVPPAVPAQTATYSETWGAVQGSYNESEEKVPDAVGRLVKQTGADTMKQNAARDHAEMAFVPVGDTCAFCIMLASRGWERVGKNAKSHAAHIHPNCDCQYIVRFSPNEGVEGYDENRYKKIYYDADPEGNWKDKLNAIRREQYAARTGRQVDDVSKLLNRDGVQITFDGAIAEKEKYEKARRIITDLCHTYDTRLQTVTTGAEKAAGDVDISGSRMRLNTSQETTVFHEFAHTLANSKADKYGLTHDADFWKEIRKINREYHRDVDAKQDVRRWISGYEHSSRDIDEFMCEAFAHAKARELGMEIPSKYGKDFTYSKQVLAVINKYFGKK